MPAGAVLLALGAAVIHATWNLLLARAPDTRAATAMQLVAGQVIWAPLALAFWRVDAEGWSYIVASAACQGGYFTLLAAAYAEGDLSLVFPLARGGAPLLVALAAAAGLGGSFGPLQAVGIAAIGCGVIVVRGVRGPWRGRDTLLAFATAACIAGYTVVDRYGVRHADPLTYLWLVLMPVSTLYAAAAARARGVAALRAVFRAPVAVAAFSAFGSYVMVLLALRLASAAPVEAVRETSIVIAVGLAGAVLGERVGRARLVGAVVVAAGTILVALG